MKETKNNMCRIPVSATMQIINGEAVMVAAEYEEIPAEKIAAFLMERFGAGQIFGSDEGGEVNDN